MSLLALIQPHVLFGIHGYTGQGYDDGVYLGSALRLVSGAIPYRDFALLHPPGITVAMVPVALLAKVIGEQDTLAVARIITALVVAANAVLVVIAVRSLGRAAMWLAGIGLAVFPLTIGASHTLLLEPYLVFFCLLGIVLAFESDGTLSSPRWLFISGVAFGFAGLMKVWAIFPVLALLAVAIPLWRTAVRPILLGLLAGFGIVALPFFLLAPGSFVSDIVLAQVGRGSTGNVELSAGDRILGMLGINALPDATIAAGVGVIVGLCAVVGVAVAYTTSAKSRSRFDWFALVAAGVSIAAMFQTPEFYSHYPYFTAPFILMVTAVCLRRVIDGLHTRTGVLARDSVTRSSFVGLTVIASVTVALFFVVEDVRFTRDFLRDSDAPSAQLTRSIRSGACVVSDLPTIPIYADRFSASSGSCSDDIDPFGMWIVDNGGDPPPGHPPFRTQFVAHWRKAFEQADYVVLSVPYSNYIPWTNDLRAYFDANYKLTYSLPRAYVYQHVGHGPSAPAPDDVSTLFDQAAAAEKAGQIDKARGAYAEILKKDPERKEAYYNLGVLDQQAHSDRDAIANYSQALKIDANYPPALFNLAIVLTPSQPSAAEALYRRLLDVNPKDANVHLNLGFLLRQEGKSDEAEQELLTAVQLNPAFAPRVTTTSTSS